MSEQLIKNELEILSGMENRKAQLEAEVEAIRNRIIPNEIREQLAELEEEYREQFEVINRMISDSQEFIKEHVLKHKGSVKIENGYQAVYSPGRDVWDSGKLDGYMAAHPEIKPFKSKGKPSVSIRRG